MSKRYGRALAAMVRGSVAPQHPWRRANTRLKTANALFQTHEVATRHGPIVFVSTHPEALHYPRELVGREPETIDWIEEEILDGAVETLRDPALRSVLIELEDTDTTRNRRIIERMERAGFTLSLWGYAHRGSANGIFTRERG